MTIGFNRVLVDSSLLEPVDLMTKNINMHKMKNVRGSFFKKKSFTPPEPFVTIQNIPVYKQ